MLFKTKKWTVIKPEEKLFIYILLAVKKNYRKKKDNHKAERE